MILSISYFKHDEKGLSSTYTTQITVLDMDRHGYTLFASKLRCNKNNCNFSYQRCVYLDLTYRPFFNLRTTSHFPLSLLKFVISSMKTGSPLVISAWAEVFFKSKLWLYEPWIHFKININLTIDHCTTEGYNLKGSGYNLFWKSPIAQYCFLNFLIVESSFLLHLQYHDYRNIL